MGFNMAGALDVSTHSRLKAAGIFKVPRLCRAGVSTHSRLKAAGASGINDALNPVGFNTQPPEGGWVKNQIV